jgi:outer membrane protein assembly factor BamB
MEVILTPQKQPLKDRIAKVGYHGEGERVISPNGSAQNWMFDLRHVFLNRDALSEFCDAFWRRTEAYGSFQIGGMETAAVPLLTALLLSAPAGRGIVNGFIIRKERKPSGLGRKIEGEITDEPIILVDDILNSGASAEAARVIISAQNGRVQSLFVVIDYRSKRGFRWRNETGIEVISLFSLDDFGVKLRPDIPAPTQRYRLVWEQSIPGGFPFYSVPKSAPLLVNDIVYRGCDSGYMHAFDANTGRILWGFQAKGSAKTKGIWSSPVHHDNRIYFGAYNGVVYCLDATTGCEVWAQSLADWIGATPVVVPEHNLLYIGLEYENPWAHGSVCALELTTGEKVWENFTRKYQHGSPAYWKKGDLIIWGTADRLMSAYCAQSGRLVWTFETGRSVKYAPTVDEERGIVAFASFDKWIYVLDAETGRKLGAWETGEICYTTPLIFNNKLFCGSGDKKLYVIDLDCFEIIETIDVYARTYSSPRLIGNQVVFGTNGGRMYEIDADTLETTGILYVPDAITNAVAHSPDGRFIFISTYMNQLLAFERLG